MQTVMNSLVVPGAIVVIKDLPSSPQMFVAECDRSSAECLWFTRNAELSRGRFPIVSLKKVNGRVSAQDSGELAVTTV